MFVRDCSQRTEPYWRCCRVIEGLTAGRGGVALGKGWVAIVAASFLTEIVIWAPSNSLKIAMCVVGGRPRASENRLSARPYRGYDPTRSEPSRHLGCSFFRLQRREIPTHHNDGNCSLQVQSSRVILSALR